MKITIEIEAKFGSDFQKETQVQALRLMIQAWEQFARQGHKQNEIQVEITKETKQGNNAA